MSEETAEELENKNFSLVSRLNLDRWAKDLAKRIRISAGVE